MADQLDDANQGIKSLRVENERLLNELRAENELNERKMRSKESVNKLYEKTMNRPKGTSSLGYTNQGESS